MNVAGPDTTMTHWAYVIVRNEDDVRQTLAKKCAADRERSHQRSAAAAGSCTEAEFRRIVREETHVPINTDCKRTTPCPGARPGAQITTRWFSVGLEIAPPGV